MDRQATLLLALGLLIAAAATVSASGWMLLIRDRRAGQRPTVTATESDEAPQTDPEDSPG